jgi:hypothetical protein
MSSNYKYNKEISLLSKCPPTDASCKDIVAWRWTAAPITDNCFHPEALNNPKRFLDSSDYTKCSAWAVSMFTSKADAKERMDQLCQNNPKLRQKKGGHVSRGSITVSDGVVTETDKNGHFNFHPSNHFDWKASFVVVGSL